ncbi:uncharacterized protein LOC141641028 [Silene latifolia]|uniref:uncharacterized protein LOC141641028 n=1 Tax=Silene latifolia TaxID=37657 RepID=UPI003D76E3E3
MEDFKNWIDECEVADCPASGSLYTWCNKQEDATRVYSRLDRVLVNHAWLQDNENVYALFYCEGVFDHTPCVVQYTAAEVKKRRSFKYFNMWSKSENFIECVKQCWQKEGYGTNMFKLVKNLKKLKWPLKRLNVADFNDVGNNASRAQMYLDYIQEKLRNDPLNSELIHQELHTASAVSFLNKASHEYLLQKSKAMWLDKGDSNSKYFHSLIKNRQDVVRCYNRKAVSPRFMLKVDLKKAYDSMNWLFLEQMMGALKFPQQFINMIMESVGTASYSLVLNGETFGHFKGKKGLRQDDLLLFSKGDVGSIMVLLRSFATFSSASGLQMNSSKTNSYFNGVPTRLWVKWISQIYLKGVPWSEYNPSGDISWGWKSVCRVRDKLAFGYTNEKWTLDSKGYTVSSGYDLLRKKFLVVFWHAYVWNGWCLPKHQFMGWLIAREVMLLKNRLHRLGVGIDVSCLICGAAAETHTHLFMECSYSKLIFEEMARLCGINIPSTNYIQWIGLSQVSALKKGVILCFLLATQYRIWMQRNRARVDGCIIRPEVLCQMIKREVKTWLQAKFMQICTVRDQSWLIYLQMSL